MDISNEELLLVRNWRTFNDKILSFRNKANISLFNQVFGEKDGERLLNHFRINCNKDFNLFETYLTSEQLQVLLKYILKYCHK